MLLPDAADEHRDRGLLLYQMGEYHEALPELRAYLDLAPAGRDWVTVDELVRHIALQLEE